MTAAGLGRMGHNTIACAGVRCRHARARRTHCRSLRIGMPNRVEGIVQCFHTRDKAPAVTWSAVRIAIIRMPAMGLGMNMKKSIPYNGSGLPNMKKTIPAWHGDCLFVVSWRYSDLNRGHPFYKNGALTC